jgi:hypothetical protein
MAPKTRCGGPRSWERGLILRDFAARWATETFRGPGSEEDIYHRTRAGVSTEPARHGLEFRAKVCLTGHGKMLGQRREPERLGGGVLELTMAMP